MLQVHLGIAAMRQFQSVPTTHVSEIKETCFEIYTKQVSCPLALPLLNISNCQSVLKYLSIVYIYMTNLINLGDFGTETSSTSILCIYKQLRLR